MAPMRCSAVSSLILILVGTFCAGQPLVDPCKNYKSIDNPYRSSKYKLKSGEVALCDNMLNEGWYRFTSAVGGVMPETKPEPYFCGTIAPIWIRGSHPQTKGQEKQVTACTNVHNRKMGCLLSSKISVKNCAGAGAGGYFVYKLKRVYGCPRAYCAGNDYIIYIYVQEKKQRDTSVLL